MIQNPYEKEKAKPAPSATLTTQFLATILGIDEDTIAIDFDKSYADYKDENAVYTHAEGARQQVLESLQNDLFPLNKTNSIYSDLAEEGTINFANNLALLQEKEQQLGRHAYGQSSGDALLKTNLAAQHNTNQTAKLTKEAFEEEEEEKNEKLQQLYGISDDLATEAYNRFSREADRTVDIRNNRYQYALGANKIRADEEQQERKIRADEEQQERKIRADEEQQERKIRADEEQQERKIRADKGQQ